MSTHSLDASGSRPLTTTTNDPARTAATVAAKPNDDVVVALGNFDCIEIPLAGIPGSVEIVTRRRMDRAPKRDDSGDIVRDADRNLVYEEVETESKTLRFRYFSYAIGLTAEGNVPHTTMRVVDLDKDPNKPMALLGDIISEERVDVGYGIEAS